MKDDKKVVNSLELTTVARDSLNKLFSKNRIRLRKIYKKLFK